MPLFLYFKFRDYAIFITAILTFFSKLSQYDFDGWAILEWECCIKSPEQGAKEGSKFIKDHIIEVSEKAFDDFASGETDQKHINDILGL